MPNHVLNELVFRDISEEAKDKIVSAIVDENEDVDFSILVPIPKNVWMGNVGQRHEKAFKRTGLDWMRENWGTKWNAYSTQPVEWSEGVLTIIFETAWSPPYPWLAAVFNTLAIPFDHNWLDEGCARGVCGKFTPNPTSDYRIDEWREEPCDDATQRRLHKLHWGVEEFPEEE